MENKIVTLAAVFIKGLGLPKELENEALSNMSYSKDHFQEHGSQPDHLEDEVVADIERDFPLLASFILARDVITELMKDRIKDASHNRVYLLISLALSLRGLCFAVAEQLTWHMPDHMPVAFRLQKGRLVLCADKKGKRTIEKMNLMRVKALEEVDKMETELHNKINAESSKQLDDFNMDDFRRFTPFKPH